MKWNRASGKSIIDLCNCHNYLFIIFAINTILLLLIVLAHAIMIIIIIIAISTSSAPPPPYPALCTIFWPKKTQIVNLQYVAQTTWKSLSWLVCSGWVILSTSYARSTASLPPPSITNSLPKLLVLRAGNLILSGLLGMRVCHRVWNSWGLWIRQCIISKDYHLQGCRSCSILPSRMGKHGVSLGNMGNMENTENMENMENINQMTQKSPEDFWSRKASLLLLMFK